MLLRYNASQFSVTTRHLKRGGDSVARGKRSRQMRQRRDSARVPGGAGIRSEWAQKEQVENTSHSHSGCGFSKILEVLVYSATLAASASCHLPGPLGFAFGVAKRLCCYQLMGFPVTETFEF
ncbi:hypothetical protein EK904_007141 [Melospiza melodia maxima]|nr:hypothetical protein EK904_007141 [Melospiza melodia maxima]